ncbi:DUF1450 domain-containing protein [Paenibacillus solisilvae]|uniref:DUF1450 domain-containing protein n=1 Tax=Paenibacillus solisilvae TaxID=2486751 RepID=A0ABW0VYH7_9BACL
MKESENSNLRIGIVVVEVCRRNQMNVEKLDKFELVYPEVAIIRTDCLNQCNLCRARPYVYVNQKRVFEKTTDQCLRTIVKIVKYELKEFYDE